LSQQTERLGALLSDEEGRQRFLQLASMLSGSGASSSDKSDAEADGQAAQQSENTNTPPSDTGGSGGADKAGLLLEMLPRLLQAMSGSGDGLDSKKINLIRALSPYLNDRRSQYIDRAIRMASVANVARDALGMLGR